MTRRRNKPALSATVLSVEAYCVQAAKTDRFDQEAIDNRYTKHSFGFFGEVGSLLSALKKVKRDQLHTSEVDLAGEEIGDALWYLSRLAAVAGVGPNVLAQASVVWLRQHLHEKPLTRKGVGFREMDSIAAVHQQQLHQRGPTLLRELAAEAGRLTQRPHQQLVQLSPTKRAEIFGCLLGHLTLVATHFDLRLEELAKRNLNKIADRWPGHRPPHLELFDEHWAEPDEQLPRRLEVEFIERKIGGKTFVVQRIKGLNIGDPLTDNSHKPDGYRYHDAFHLAYMVFLGWSPVIRALLKRKRKSHAPTDENEDGARAIIIEEGIATWIFNHALRRELYRKVDPGRLDYTLLTQIRNMVLGYEAQRCPLWQWEQAILEGFRVFRQLLDNKGGTLTADLRQRRLTYVKPKAIPA